MEKVALIGADQIGCGWAIVFARAGFQVSLYDADAAVLGRCMALISSCLDELEIQGLLEWAEYVRPRIEFAASLASALEGAEYVQESVAEDLELRRQLYSTMDQIAEPTAILASSSATQPASLFTDHLPGRERCLVAHPGDPPYLIPIVELVPSPWTDAGVIARTLRLMERIGQSPVVLKHEIQGFIYNRLQGAMLGEAFRLVENGYATVEDIDRIVREGLGLNWSLTGPFEAADLAAPGGLRDFVTRYGAEFQEILQSQAWLRPWDEELVASVEEARRHCLPQTALAERRAWRDRQLMQLWLTRNRSKLGK